MKRALTVVCCLSFFSLSVLAEKRPTKAAAMGDQQFVSFAAQTDMVEANLGQLAQTAATAKPVRDYAQTIVTDHTSDFGQLNNAARNAGLKVPSAIDAEHDKTTIIPFQRLKGAAFDQRYLQEMIAKQSSGIAIYKREAANGRNPALKSYADKTLPVLEKDLANAKNLEKSKTS
ncbi:MAG: DUF4142 domain-containing protein [Terracidiphilus sp.]